MRRLVFLVIIFLAIMSNILVHTKVDAATQNIQTVEIKGAIVPVTADYVNRAIDIAEDNNSVVIILMDTPGGLGTGGRGGPGACIYNREQKRYSF